MTFALVICALALPLRRWIVTPLIMTNTQEIVAARAVFPSMLLLLSEYYENISPCGRFISNTYIPIYSYVANMAASACCK
jgi:hypothetical protein